MQVELRVFPRLCQAILIGVRVIKGSPEFLCDPPLCQKRRSYTGRPEDYTPNSVGQLCLSYPIMYKDLMHSFILVTCASAIILQLLLVTVVMYNLSTLCSIYCPPNCIVYSVTTWVTTGVGDFRSNDVTSGSLPFT